MNIYHERTINDDISTLIKVDDEGKIRGKSNNPRIIYYHSTLKQKLEKPLTSHTPVSRQTSIGI